MNKLLVFIFMALNLMACGFSSDEQEQAGTITKKKVISTLKLNPEEDSDGDLVSNGDEVAIGRNPLVADIPKLEFKFMKDFTLKGSDKEINSLRDIRSKNFEYRVGDITLKQIANKTTARFARYNGVFEGEYQDIDLTRISYPHVSPRFIAKLSAAESLSLTNSNLSFSNTLKLKRNQGFQKIVNPRFNFHYLNYESGEYELIGSKSIEGNVFEGVLEKFQVELESLPEGLIAENFLKRGELITAEIDDFEIPSLETTQSKLMASVLEKTVPITVITPLETKVHYVTLTTGHNKLAHFLKSIYGDNFQIENNTLTQIEGLSNNLSSYTYLNELRAKTKEGKWFILFNGEINDDVFQYEFKKGDKIVLNYMLGSELANQSYHQEIKSLNNVSSELSKIDVEVGEIAQNDELQIILNPNHLRHEYFNTGSHSFNDSAGHASWVFHDLASRRDSFSFTDVNIQKRISLVLNAAEYSLFDLISEKKLSATFEDNKLKLYIPMAKESFDLSTDESYSLLLRIYPDNYQADIGLWQRSIGGWIAGQSGCRSADAICKKWYRTKGIPLGRVCARIQSDKGNACTGRLKSEYRKKRRTLRRDLNFSANFLIINKFN